MQVVGSRRFTNMSAATDPLQLTAKWTNQTSLEVPNEDQTKTELTEMQLIARHINWLKHARNGKTQIVRIAPGREPPPVEVQEAIQNSLSENTRRAYASDIAKFSKWGGKVPSTPVEIASFLTFLANDHKAASIVRMLASLSKAHRAFGFDDPCKSEMVKSTMRGIRRMIGSAQRAAKPILKDDLFAMLERMESKTIDIRDKALLLIGFAGAFRRSELVGLDVGDIENVRQGIILNLRSSKTDQEGKGRKIGIPFGRTRWCPVRHLVDWITHAGIAQGPLFRSVTKGSKVADCRLSGEAICIAVKRRLRAAGYDPTCFSGHSLRAGLATSAAIAGAQTWKIRQQTGHASDAMLGKYIRDGELFSDNVSGLLL